MIFSENRFPLFGIMLYALGNSDMGIGSRALAMVVAIVRASNHFDFTARYAPARTAPMP